MTLTNLPAFVTQNVPEADFTVPSTLDLSLIGQYTVTIRGEIQVPVDAKKSAYTTHAEEYDFLVTIEPCIITDYADTVRVIELRYNIGHVDKTEGFYQFDETPFCGYPETVTLQNLPGFVNHNSGSSDFTIPQNSDLAIIGEYTANI